tara:strand:- start:1969 stop:2883 length:915 start_codon:yes stop_codon:yes gene_type:complete
MSKYPKANILVAYPYFKKEVFDSLKSRRPDEFRLIVDCGAYTAWNLGTEISLEDYCAFLKTLPSEWEIVITQLDVVGNPTRTYENWHRMLDKGIDATPVFTRGADLKYLEEFYDYSDLVLLGGVGRSRAWKNYLVWFMNNNQGRDVHWFGITESNLLKHYKPRSTDSALCTFTRRYGVFYFYTGNGELETVPKASFRNKPPRRFFESCMRLGFTAKEISLLAHNERWKGSANLYVRDGEAYKRGYVDMISFAHHLYRSMIVEKMIGTYIYLASTIHDVETLWHVYDLFEKRGILSKLEGVSNGN